MANSARASVVPLQQHQGWRWRLAEAASELQPAG
jgi:hypothetical protein